MRSNFEQTTSLYLRQRGFEEFCPSYKTQREWSDRKKIIEVPLFTGYVFCRLNVNDRLPVLTAPGVVDLVGFGKRPTPVSDTEISHIKQLVDCGVLVVPWPYLKLGQRVVIEEGPLKGVEGILQEVKGKYRLVLSVSLLQRSVSAEIDRFAVRPLGN